MTLRNGFYDLVPLKDLCVIDDNSKNTQPDGHHWAAPACPSAGAALISKWARY